MVKQVITFSDGTETVITYKENPLGAEAIEAKVAEEVDAHRGEAEMPETFSDEVVEDASEAVA